MSVICRRILGKVGVGLLCIVLLSLACNPFVILTSSTAVDPQDAGAYVNSGNSFFELGDYDRAIADYDKAIALNPQDADAYYNRGLAYYHKGDYDQAITDFNQAIALDPQHALAYLGRGLARLSPQRRR